MPAFIADIGKKEQYPWIRVAVVKQNMDTTKQKRRVYEILKSPPSPDNPWGRVVASVLILLIFLNVIAAVLETDPGIFQRYGQILDTFALLSVLVFVVEYLLRVWCCTEDPRYHAPVTGRLRYMATPLALIDLAVILPFLLLPLVASPKIYWMVRFSRIFWILKIGHYSQSLKTFSKVLKAKKGEIFMAFFAMLVLLIIASALEFLAENQAQPTKFSSVIATLWWGVETLATIGYGDMVPITPQGKFIAAFVALLGIGLFALPAGILASGFIEALHKDENVTQKSDICPHCGKDIRKEPDEEEH